MIYAGAVCWSVAAIDAIYHLVNGDLVVPLGMASVGMGYVALRRAAMRRRRALVAVPSEVG